MKSKYWYLIEYFECVLCGHTKKYLTRNYTSKPENREARISYCNDYCGCADYLEDR